MAMTTIPKLIAIIALLAAAGALAWFATPPRVTQAQTITDYDANDNGLIDISSIAQLNAIRHDLDGNGVTAAAAYDTAFPDRETSATGTMGCPAGACNGYELTASLTFVATSTWAPINNFNTTLDGAGHTITGLNVSVSAAVDAGMFRYLAGSARIRDLGLINASVTSTVGSNRSNGILAGTHRRRRRPDRRLRLGGPHRRRRPGRHQRRRAGRLPARQHLCQLFHLLRHPDRIHRQPQHRRAGRPLRRLHHRHQLRRRPRHPPSCRHHPGRPSREPQRRRRHHQQLLRYRCRRDDQLHRRQLGHRH